jgi:hypothetical protein
VNDDFDILKLQVGIWKMVAKTQQHFDLIEMRIRALLLTLIGILLTVATGFAEHTTSAHSSQSHEPSIIATSYTMTIVLGLCCVFALLFGYMDRFWYHTYLRGAVACGEHLEKLIQKRFETLMNDENADLGLALNQSISKQSHEKMLGRRRSTSNRLVLFYGAIAYLSGGGAILTRYSGSVAAWTVIPVVGIVLLVLWAFGKDSA